MDAVGPYHDVVANVAGVGKGDVDTATVIVQALGNHPQPHLHTEFARLGSQDTLQIGTPYACIRGIVRSGQPRGREFRDLLARRSKHLGLVEAECLRHVGVQQVEFAHGAYDVELLDDADAVDGPVGVLFDDLDGVSLAAQCDGSRQPADATADNEHRLCIA